MGFVAASVFMYLFYRTAKRIIVERQITPRHIARWSFQALCFFYLMFINANIMVVRSAVRIVEFTLRCESCHLDRALNVEIGVEYRKILVVVFLNVYLFQLIKHSIL